MHRDIAKHINAHAHIHNVISTSRRYDNMTQCSYYHLLLRNTTLNADNCPNQFVFLLSLAAVNIGQAHSPAAAGAQYGIQSCVGTLQWTDT